MRGLALHYDQSTFCGRSRDMTVNQRGTPRYSDVQNKPKAGEDTHAMDFSDDEDDVAGFTTNNDDDDAHALEASTNGSPTPTVATPVQFRTAPFAVDHYNLVQFVLLTLSNRFKAPRYGYDQILRWSKFAQVPHFSFHNIQTRYSAMESLEHLFAMKELRPVLRDATVRVLKAGADTADTFDQLEAVVDLGHPTISELDDNEEDEGTGGYVDEARPKGTDVHDDDSSVSSTEEEEDCPFIDEGHPLITTRTIKVVCTPLRAALIHLLRNRPALYDPDNLVVNQEPGETYNKYVPPNGRLGEVLTGSWYSDSWDRKVGGDKTKFLCPLILFMDETITEFMGRYGLEPLVFTFAIFKEKIRRKAVAWQAMGMAPCTRRYKSSKQNAREAQLIMGIHIDNLHRVLDVLLNELIQIQNEGGLEVDVCFTGDGIYVRRTFIFSIAFIMGDCKGNNNLAGRYGSHAKGVRKISRACNCRSKDADNTNFKCQFITKAEVASAVTRQDMEELQDLSQHNIKNAFHNVCFGGDPHNIHGCTPLDVVCHVSQLGIYKYTMKVFF